MITGTKALEVDPGDHVVLFYRDEDELAGQVSDYLLEAVGDGGAAIVIATPAHRLAFEERLACAGLDVAAAQAAGSYLAFDANETMRRFMVASRPDPAGFWQVISPVIRQASQSGRPLHLFGEMVALLWDAGLVGAAIEVEAMWNELAGQYLFTLFCAYPASSVSGSEHLDALSEVCHAHTAAAGTPQE